METSSILADALAGGPCESPARDQKGQAVTEE